MGEPEQHSPFVGRRVELSVLRALLGRPAAGRGGLALVTGGAGIGKSRLVATALAEPGTPSVVGFGECLPDLLMPPLWPVRRAVASARRALGRRGGPWADVGDAEPSPAPRASPADPTGAAAAAGPGWDRLAVVADLADRLLVAAASSPAVLVLEDLHWADAETLALLRMLAPELTRTPLVVLATARPPTEEHRVAGLVALAAGPATESVPLRPLTEPEVHEYLDRAGYPGEPARVLTLSGGLPLLLPAAVAAEPGEGVEPVGADVATLVRRLTLSLTPEQVRVLEGASLVLTGLDTEVVSAAADVTAEVAVRATDAAVRSGLLVRAPDGRDLAFAHELVRRTLADRVPAERARAVHRRAAVVLAHRPGVPAVRVAAHWEAAGPDQDAAAHAVEWWGRAAEEATALRAHEDAATHRARAARSAVLAGLPPGGVVDAHLESARAWHRAGRYDEAVAATERAAALAERTGRADQVAEAALALGWVSYPQAQAVVGRLSRSALRAGAALPEATRARLLAQQVAALGGRAEARGTGLATEAMALARRSGDPVARLEAIGAWMTAAPETGPAEEECAYAEEAVELATALAEPVPLVMAHSWRLNAVVRLGRADQLDVELEALRLVAERSRLPLAEWHRLRATVAVAILRGDFGVVDDLHRRATEVARDSGDVVAANVGNAAVYEAAHRRGEPLADPEEQLRVLRAAPPSPLTDAPRALLLLRTGRHDEARAVYHRLLPLLGRHPEQRPWWPVLYLLLELAEGLGDAAAAALLADELEPYGRHSVGGLGTSTVWYIGHSHRQLGRALVVAGRLEEAVDAYRTALGHDERLGAGPDVALGHLGIARTLARPDWPGPGAVAARRTALVEARRAAALCRTYDMPGHAADAEALVAALATRTAADDPLSPREREVADLVVAGLSNHDIAARLVLSERTVESHVRSVLMKRGCRNRGELIRLSAGGGTA